MYPLKLLPQESLPRSLDAAPEALPSDFIDMLPGQSVTIDPSNPLVVFDEAYECPRLANVYAGNDRFSVMAQRWDERQRKAVGPYSLVHEVPGVDPQDRVESVNFTNSSAVVDHSRQGRPFNVGGTVDNEHFQITDGRKGMVLTNFSFSSETVLQQAPARQSAGFRETILAYGSSIREKLGQFTLGTLGIENCRAISIRAERAESKLRKFLGGVARLMVEPLPEELFDQEPIEVLDERSRRVANAAMYGVEAIADGSIARVHRNRKWGPGNKSRYDDGITNSVRREFADSGSQDDRAPYGYFRNTNFAIIGRDSPTVKGGVYVAKDQEAILMDHRSPQMREASSEMKNIVIDMYGGAQLPPDVDILWKVLEYTRYRLPYKSREYDSLVRPLIRNNGIMPMSELLDRELAICNGQAPFAAFLVEELIYSGLLHGVVSVERKIDRRTGIGHATIAFDPQGNTNPERVIVVDLSGRDGGFVGTRGWASAISYWYDFDLPAAS